MESSRKSEMKTMIIVLQFMLGGGGGGVLRAHNRLFLG